MYKISVRGWFAPVLSITTGNASHSMWMPVCPAVVRLVTDLYIYLLDTVPPIHVV